MYHTSPPENCTNDNSAFDIEITFTSGNEKGLLPIKDEVLGTQGKGLLGQEVFMGKGNWGGAKHAITLFLVVQRAFGQDLDGIVETTPVGHPATDSKQTSVFGESGWLVRTARASAVYF
jgi:hypothetical protein